MANFARVNLSGENLGLAAIANHYSDIESSLRFFFGSPEALSQSRFVGEKPASLQESLQDCLAELERSVVLNLLASLEASLRIDYLLRCYKKKKDKLSREFRKLYSKRGPRASLEDEILPLWKKSTDVQAQVISDLKGAFKYRHWLAHGRYWVPKLGQKYDYIGVFILAEKIYSFPLVRSEDAA